MENHLFQSTEKNVAATNHTDNNGLASAIQEAWGKRGAVSGQNPPLEDHNGCPRGKDISPEEVKKFLHGAKPNEVIHPMNPPLVEHTLK